MVDHVSSEKRSEIMRQIRGKNTRPELIVRGLISALGYRYRLYGKNLPGKPDLVFPGRKKVIYVHGCFWHCHQCKMGKPPKSRLEYWIPKLKKNRERDVRNQKMIKTIGWEFLIIWQCQMNDTSSLANAIINFLEY